MRIGIDCGSLTVKGALLDDNHKVLATEHEVHEGEVLATTRKVLFSLLDGHDSSSIEVALTGRHSGVVGALCGLEPLDPVAAEITGSKVLFGRLDHIIHMGGGSVMLASLDSKGNLLDFTTNSACAAGTGSFLDEQAARMGLSHEQTNAIKPIDSPPSVATRCAVFAKTDLIHRQQEGFGREELWCGLCHGMSRTAIQTLLKGRELSGRIAVTGGVSANPGMVHYLNQVINSELMVVPESPVCAAVGAAVEGPFKPSADLLKTITKDTEGPRVSSGDSGARRPVLELRKSTYPDFSVPTSYVDHADNEVRVHVPSLDGLCSGLLMGVDVGSTSTKVALCDPEGHVIIDIYRRTEGDPVGAGRKLLDAMREMERRFEVDLDIKAVGTTGSGRKIVGAIFGADLVVNEISAHVRGAVSVDPDVTTIFEIGGQDSKYMRIQDGRIADANMNYVCAAGTGTFVEELGRKLGFKVEETGPRALGSRPPHTSDRCTVFMEQDASNLGRDGVSHDEIMAAILFSVIENYKTKVVGNRPVDRDCVMFQGATARNEGLVAAVENVFDVEVVVSPYCHVMGAIGAAMLADEHVEARGIGTSFRGLGLADLEVCVTTSECDLCTNKCVITTAEMDGMEESPSFGYLCGREPEEEKMRKNLEYAPFRRHKAALKLKGSATTKQDDRPRIGVPTTLSTYGYAPLFRRLLESLGCVPVFSDETDRGIAARGSAAVGSDFCFPVKVAHGHVEAMCEREDLDAVFIPAMIEEVRNEYTTRRRFCPYLEALPSVVKSIFDDRPLGPTLVDPVLDFNYPVKMIGAEIAKAFAGVLDLTVKKAARAWLDAVDAQNESQESLTAKGTKVLDTLESEGKKGIVVIGRPYNTLDPIVSINLPLRISEFGFHVIPMEQLPFKPELLDPGHENMFWSYGQRVLSAVKQVADNPNLYCIFLTSFNCGPDSFILTMAEDLMGDKPMLILELDEHGADGGYVTRVEAFLDVICAGGIGRSNAPVVTAPLTDPVLIRQRKLWIPRLHPFNAGLFAAVFRGHGFDAQELPETDEEAHSLGKAATRGSECTPMALTLGTFLKVVRDSGLPPDRHAFFMPTATGSCRFGAYSQAQHTAMKRLGMGDVPIMSPSSENAYLGLPSAARKEVWEGLLCGDYLFKAVLCTRPYERDPGAVDSVAGEWLKVLQADMEARRDPRPTLESAVRAVLSKARRGVRNKPLAGIVGEIYVRCDPFANARVIEAIEEAGGEAWLAPFGEWINYTVWVERMHVKTRDDTFMERVLNEFGNMYIERKDREYHKLMQPLLKDRMEPSMESVTDAGQDYIKHEFEGESILTVGRAVRFFEEGADLVVNASPFGCMHGHISGAIFESIIEKYGRPVVTSFYDGTTKNTNIRSFILAAQKRRDMTKAARRKSQRV